MPRLPRITAADMIRVLEKNGFVLERQRRHKVYFNAAGRRVTVPYHSGTILEPKTLKSILRETGWTVQMFVMLLEES